MRGSSPLTRGKPHGTLVHRDDCGLIPAHAGKTMEVVVNVAMGEAHPRSRGENIITDANPLSRHGSSPLTRGKRLLRSRISPRPGLIPAHAGKTTLLICGLRSSWAHPRSRGENTGPPSGKASPPGSSPLTRGKRGGRRKGQYVRGLIPAHAGKTLVDHVSDALALGSSPLTRGKPTHGYGG